MFDSCKSWEGSVSRSKKSYDLFRSVETQIDKNPLKIIKDLQNENQLKDPIEMCKIHLSTNGEYSDEYRNKYITFLVENRVINSQQTSALYEQLKEESNNTDKKLSEHERYYRQFCDENVDPALKAYIEYQRRLLCFSSGSKTLGEIAKRKDDDLEKQEKQIGTYIKNHIDSHQRGSFLWDSKTPVEKLRTSLKVISECRAEATKLILGWDGLSRENSTLDKLQAEATKLILGRDDLSREISRENSTLDKLQEARNELARCLSSGSSSEAETQSILYKDISGYHDKMEFLISLLKQIHNMHKYCKNEIDSKKVDLHKLANVLGKQKELKEEIWRYKLEEKRLGQDIKDAWSNHGKVQQIEREIRERNRRNFIIEELPPTNELKSAWEGDVPRPEKSNDLFKSIEEQKGKKPANIIKDLQNENKKMNYLEMCDIHLSTDGKYTEEYITFLKGHGLTNSEQMYNLYTSLVKKKMEVESNISKHEQHYKQFCDEVLDPALKAYSEYQRRVLCLYSESETLGEIATRKNTELSNQEIQIKTHIKTHIDRHQRQYGREIRAGSEGIWRLLGGSKTPVEELCINFNKISEDRPKVIKLILGWDDLSRENSPLEKLRKAGNKLASCLRSCESSESGSEAILYKDISDYHNKVGTFVNLLDLIYKRHKKLKDYISLEKAGLTKFANVLAGEKGRQEKIWSYKLEEKRLDQDVNDTWSNYRKVPQ